MKAITPDSRTIICGLTDTVSTPAHFWPATDIPGYLVRLLYLQIQNIRQERHIENKNRNNFKSVQTPVMRMSSSGYDAHKCRLMAPHTFSPLLSVNSYEWFGKPGYSYAQKLHSSPSRDGQQRKKKGKLSNFTIPNTCYSVHKLQHYFHPSWSGVISSGEKTPLAFFWWHQGHQKAQEKLQPSCWKKTGLSREQPTLATFHRRGVESGRSEHAYLLSEWTVRAGTRALTYF